MKAGQKFKAQRASKGKKSKLFYLIAILLIAYFLFLNLRNSAFFNKQDRVNIVAHENDKIAYYSIGLNDRINYFIPFFSDLEVVVPGGYGYYRLGALGKLVSLEKDPKLFQRTYSTVSSSKVDYYFYSREETGTDITFGRNKTDFFSPSASLIFLGNSNANFFDRLYIYLKFLGKTNNQFKVINSLSINDQGKRIAFLSEEFFEALQGIFYKRTYRSEKRDVQIIYTGSYNTALQTAQILEGEGIRVVDFSPGGNLKESCEIIEETKNFSITGSDLSQFFGCKMTVGNTEAYDIILKLGKEELKWEVE